MVLSIKLLLCAALIFYAALQLTKYADILAEKLNLSRTWIGVVLLATITSLPELSNSLSSVIFVGEPDLGVGNLIGACLMNLIIIAFLDYLHKGKSLFSKLDIGQVLSASFAILLLALTVMGIFSASYLNAKFIMLLIFLAFLAGQRLIFIFEKGKIFELPGLYGKERLGPALIKFLFFASLVIMLGIWLSTLGNGLAIQTGWGRTFVGSLILALATTLPELTVSFAALRLGSPDMAAGNLLGSILFNIAILPLLDIFCWKAPLFNTINNLHIITALAGILCLSIVIAGIIRKTERKVFRQLSWNSILIVLIALSSWYLLFLIRKA